MAERKAILTTNHEFCSTLLRALGLGDLSVKEFILHADAAEGIVELDVRLNTQVPDSDDANRLLIELKRFKLVEKEEGEE